MNTKKEIKTFETLGLGLTKLKTFITADGSIQLSANLTKDGFVIANVLDKADGSEMIITPVLKEKLDNVYSDINALSPIYVYYNGKNHIMKITLDLLISVVVDDKYEKDFVKKNEKRGIVYKEHKSLGVIRWGLPLKELLEKRIENKKTVISHYRELISNPFIEVLNKTYLSKLDIR
jgi:hypothetical protein